MVNVNIEVPCVDCHLSGPPFMAEEVGLREGPHFRLPTVMASRGQEGVKLEA